MSHYRSGRYYVELDKRRAIESDCQKKLQQAQQEQAAARAEAERVKRELENDELQLSIRAQEMRRDADDVQMQQQREAQQMKARVRAKLIQLDAAANRLLTVYRSDPATEDLKVRVEQLHRMLDLDHDTTELLRLTEEYLQRELPSWESKLRIRSEADAAHRAATHLTQIRGTAKDYSESFVSLKKKRNKEQTVRRTPWETFCARVQALLDQQQDMATVELLELSEEMERVVPAQQKQFMIDNQQLLEDLEDDAAAVVEMLDQAAAQLENQVKRYTALCSLLELAPERRFMDLQADSQTYAQLVAENNRLWQQYLLWEEENYVDRNLEEVFARYGIRFDNLETAATADGTVRMRCDLANSTCLTMTKSSGGAFEMEFTGVSASSTVSMDERRRVAAEAQSFCSLMPQIAAELAARGILISSSYEEEPTAESIRIEQRETQTVIYEKQALRTMK